MGVMPDSDLQLYMNVPFDTNYNDTIMFASENTQRDYFVEKRAYGFPNLQYVRAGENQIKLNISADNARLCNYMGFRNNAYNSKWFYAFITAVDYVNDNTSLITFHVDVLQTWLFQLNPPMCLVAREHVNSDGINENYQPEPINVGDIIPTDINKDWSFNSFMACIAAGDKITIDGVEAGCSVFGGILQGIDILPTGIDVTPDNYASAVSTMKSIIDGYVDANAQDSIISMFIMPSQYITSDNAGIVTKQENGTNRPSTLDGYEPKNKKLLHYPYTYLAVDTGAKCANYRWEYFTGVKTGTAPAFAATCTYTPTPEAALVPKNYNGKKLDYTSEIKTGNFGQVAFTTDSYKAWIANNGNAWNLSMSRTQTNAVLSGISQTMGLAGNVISGNVGGALSSTVGLASTAINAQYDIADLNNQKAVAQNQPDHVKGQQQTDIDMVNNAKGFWFKTMSMRAENAQVADDFLSMYGYACNRVKVPNLKGRKYWNYVQTVDADFTGQFVQEYANEMSAAFNKGVRFWHTRKYFKDYSVDNAIE